jgi:hypothetical protein
MTAYQVTAWCAVPHYTVFDVEAENMTEALEKARTQAQGEYGEPCDGGAKCDWDEFEIVSEEDADEHVRYLEPALSAEIAAPELLEAAILAEDVLSELARLDDGTPSVSALSLLRAAIKKAAGGKPGATCS